MYFKYARILFKSQIQYRASFVLLSLASFMHPFFAFVSLSLLFQRFGNLKGWNMYEVALCLGVINVAYAIAECFVRGFDLFPRLVVNGGFDRVLVRPRGTILQVLGSNFEFSRIGRFAEGVIILIYALLHVSVSWNVYKVITFAFMIMSGVIIFSGVFILGATLCFWTIQGLELVNIFTDGGKEVGQYPLQIYAKWVRLFFTFVIPYASINYLPLMFILGKVHGNAALYMLSPLIGILFIVPCLAVWNFGVRHYKSTGS